MKRTKWSPRVLIPVLAAIGSLLGGGTMATAERDRPVLPTSTDASVQSGPSYRDCSDGGITGEVRFHYVYNGSFVRYVGLVEYRILWADSNRNHANIVWRDQTTGHAFGIPDPPDNGLQDGNWHVLPGNPNGYYRPRYGAVSVGFVFDTAGDDPQCLVSWNM